MEINKIYNENCLDTMKRMENDFVDLVVTSPPYDGLRDYKGYSFPFEEIAKELFRVLKQGGVMVWVVGDSVIDGTESGTSFKQALHFKEIGFNLHDTMIYEKAGFSYPNLCRYHQVFEYMFILSKGKPKTFNPIMDHFVKWKGPWGRNTQRKKDGSIVEMQHRERRKNIVGEYGMRYNIWRYSTGGSDMSSPDEVAFEHPAIMPEKLAKDHILSWSNEGDVVYDCFGGAGTTAKMAHLQRRNWIMSEISNEYCKVAEKRLDGYLAQTFLF